MLRNIAAALQLNLGPPCVVLRGVAIDVLLEEVQGDTDGWLTLGKGFLYIPMFVRLTLRCFHPVSHI